MQQIFIDGTWVHAQEGSTRAVTNPANLEPIDTVADCGPVEVARAVDAAHAAQPGWHKVPAADRAALLREIGGRIRDGGRDLATLLTRETGKPLCESLDCIDAVVALFETGGAGAPHSAGSPSQQPGAVLAAIAPFNFPLLFMACAIAPAIAAGGTVVCKPPPQNPLSSLMLARACGALPAGVFNVITGGADTGQALVRHAAVGQVRFTGSAAVGRTIAAAAQGKQLDLELGSVDAFVVCKDADLEVAVPAIAWARLLNAGQVCTSGKHIYVERSIAAEFVGRIHQSVGFLDVDDPMKPATDLGPLVSLDAAHRVEDQVGRSLREGAKLILGGRRFRPSGLPGHFFQPTILSDVRPGSVPTREEILGPVITITPVIDVAEALRFASASAAGCGASIYTSDPQAAARVVESVESGRFRINDPICGNALGPFGGMRHRGIVRGLGGAGVGTFEHSKYLEVAETLERKPWWFPYADRTRRMAGGA
jgi:acyl-CoA reductase-like NAD-dependent aldehyde dehydrogenase